MTTSLNNLRPFASKDEEINKLRKHIAELEAKLVNAQSERDHYKGLAHKYMADIGDLRSVDR